MEDIPHAGDRGGRIGCEHVARETADHGVDLGRPIDLAVLPCELDLSGLAGDRPREQQHALLLELGRLAAPAERHVDDISDSARHGVRAANQCRHIGFDDETRAIGRETGRLFALELIGLADPRVEDQRRAHYLARDGGVTR